MDAGVVRRYMARLAEAGLTEKMYVLIGIVPLRSVKSAHWIRDKLFGAIIPDAVVARLERANDPIAEGRRICLDMVPSCPTFRMSPAATSWRRATTPWCPTSSPPPAKASRAWRRPERAL